MRCLALARALSSDTEHSIHFICRQMSGAFEHQIQLCGFDLTLIPDEITDVEGDLLVVRHLLEDLRPDWMIVDSYVLDAVWEQGIRDQGVKVLAIDDYGCREHRCDMLLDQNLGAESDHYTRFLPENSFVMAGADYALLRPEFRLLRYCSLEARRIQKKIKQIMITLGYAAPVNTIKTILDGILQSELAFANVTIVHGDAQDIVLDWQGKSDIMISVHEYVEDMATMMMDSDLLVTNAGSTSWERCCLGVPAIMVIMAENQIPVSHALHQNKAGISLGSFIDMRCKDIADAIHKISSPASVAKMSASAASVCDGLGARRVSLELLPERAADEATVTFRPVTQMDVTLLYQWQCFPETRRYARNVNPPTFEEHLSWFAERLAAQHGVFSIIEYDRQPAGVLRLDITSSNYEEYEISIFIIPERMKMGIASAALRTVKRLLPDDQILAEILPENSASQTLFERAGYAHIRDNWYRCPPH